MEVREGEERSTRACATKWGDGEENYPESCHGKERKIIEKADKEARRARLERRRKIGGARREEV